MQYVVSLLFAAICYFIYSYVAVCMFCAVRCVIIICCNFYFPINRLVWFNIWFIFVVFFCSFVILCFLFCFYIVSSFLFSSSFNIPLQIYRTLFPLETQLQYIIFISLPTTKIKFYIFKLNVFITNSCTRNRVNA